MSDQLTFSGSYAYGFVESIKDPKDLNRVQVRIIGVHTNDKKVLPTENLPWCQVLLPVTSNESSSHGIRVGHCVKCSFLDSVELQIPIVEGILPGIVAEGQNFLGLTDKSLSKYADGRNVVKKHKVVSGQPDDPYNAEHPFNHVFETQSGHRIEVDDTPGSERVHFFHKSGSNTEFHPDGSYVTSVEKNNYVCVKGDDVTIIDGDRSVKVKGNSKEQVEGNISIEVKGNVDISVNGDVNCQANGKISLTSVSDISILAGGNIVMNASGTISIG